MPVKAVRGFEDSTITNGLGIFTGSSQTYSTATRHQTLSGYGGSQSLKFISGGSYKITGLTAGGVADKIHVATFMADGASVAAQNVVFHDSANLGQFTIQFGVDGLVRLQRGSAILAGNITIATSVGTFARDAWNTWKVEITCREAASAGRCRVWLNGDTVALVDTGAGVDCRATTTDDFAHVLLHCASTHTNGQFFDDFYWVSSGETVPDEALYIVPSRPTSDGAVQFTPSSGTNHGALSESPITTAIFNEAGTAGFEDRLNVDNLSQTPTSILCVAPFGWGTGDGTITQARTLIESNGSTTYGTNQTLPSGNTYGPFFDYYTTDPSGGAAFTKARHDAMLPGYEAN